MNFTALKKSLALLLSLVMLGLLVACGPATTDEGATTEAPTEDAATEEAPAEEGSGEKTVVNLSTYATSEQTIDYIGQFIETPVEENVDVDLVVQLYPDRNTLLIEVAGGAGPDIMDLDGPTDVVEFVQSERAVPLTDYAEQYGWGDMFMDWAVDSCYYDGVLYSLPTVYEGLGIVYNKTVMEENGWEYPNTVAEWETLMDEILEAGLTPISFGNANYQGAVDWLYSAFTSCYGGVDNLIKVLEGDEKFNENQPLVDSMQMLVDYWQKGYIDNNSQSITDLDAVARLASGDAVMEITGTWVSGTLTADHPDSEWTFRLLPPVNEGDPSIFPVAIGGSYVINANSAPEVQDKSAEVLSYIFSEANAANHYEQIAVSGAQPHPTKWFDPSQLSGLDPKVVELYDVLDTALQSGDVGFCSWTFYPAEARVYMNENTDSLFLDVLTVDEYLTTTQTYIDSALADGTAPQVPHFGE